MATARQGISSSHSSARPSQLNPTATASRCRCSCRCNTENGGRIDSERMAVDRSPDIPALTDGSSILGDSIISIDNQEPLVVYSVPFDGEDEVDDGFVLLPRDQENEQLSSSGYLMGDQQSSPWHPPLEEIYDEGDDGYSGGQRSMSSSMLDSIIVECSEPSAEQLAGSMTSSRISRWSGSASLYLRHVGSCFDEMAELNPDSYPQTIDLM